MSENPSYTQVIIGDLKQLSAIMFENRAEYVKAFHMNIL